MNLWRYIGVTVFLIAVIGFIGANNKSFGVGGKDEKDKKVEPKTDDKKVTPKTDDKKVEPKTDDKKVTPKTDDKKVTPKTDDKKIEPKTDDKKIEPKTDDKKVTPKTDDKKPETKTDDKKVTPKTDDKKPETKTDDKKPEVKTPVTPSGEKLTFKAFDKDTVIYQLQETKTTQEMTVNNQKVTQTQTQKFLIEWKSTDSKEKYVVTQQVVGIQMDIDIGGNKIKYYSTEGAKNPKNPMTDFFVALMKNKLTFTITSDLEKVESIGGRKEFIKDLGDVNPQMNTLLEQILSEDALKRMAEPTWWAFPAKGEIPASKTWKKESTLTLGPIGSYKTDFTFTHKDTKEGKDTIDVKTNLTYTAPTQNTGLPFKVVSADLKTEAGTGSATFDRAKGRFDKSNLEMKLTGKLVIEVGNAKTEVGLVQTQISSSATLDAIPDAWKAK